MCFNRQFAIGVSALPQNIQIPPNILGFSIIIVDYVFLCYPGSYNLFYLAYKMVGIG